MVVQRRRLDLDWSQEKLATKVRVSRQWISSFENGKGSVELRLVLRVLRALDLIVDIKVLPEPDIDLGALGDA